jgi:glycosyl transferase family 52
VNYVVVRTRLQAILALELIEAGQIEKPFILIELYQYRIGEDAESVYRYYNLLSKKAYRTRKLIQFSGLWTMAMKLYLICWHAKLTSGKLYAAVVNLYPLAIALKLCPKFSINSFDDGTANIQKRSSSYHALKPLDGRGIKRRLARVFFPRGASHFIRGRISQHYTIFPGQENIVPHEQCVGIKLNWANYLHPADENGLPQNVRKILLGTVYEDPVDSDKESILKQKRDVTLKECDLYIPHPREKVTFDSPKIFNLTSPAESLIEYLANKNELIVYHFNSSAVINFLEYQRIKIVDLCKEKSSI